MDESPGAEEVQEAGTPPRGFFLPSNVGHCLHGGMGLLSAVAYRATPVLRTVATTEVAGEPSDGDDGVEPSSSNAIGISFRNSNHNFVVSLKSVPRVSVFPQQVLLKIYNFKFKSHQISLAQLFHYIPL